jgi:SAM-dependent methyltransferase
VRILRNYVTHWLREDRPGMARGPEIEPSITLGDELEGLRARFSTKLGEPDCKRVNEWIDELKRRVSGDGPRSGPRTITDRRLQSWQHAAALRQLLRVPQRPPTEREIYDVENALRGRNSPETVHWNILLARAWLTAALHGSIRTPDDETGWDRAMRTLLVAASVAAARQLPYEMAGTLAASAYLTRTALSKPKLRAELTRQGADEDGVRVQAAECALTAADAYLWLSNQSRHCRSVLEAVRLLQGSPFPERLIQAFQLLSLARNNRLLAWQPPQIPDESGRAPSPDDRFVRYPDVPHHVRFTEAEHTLFEDIHAAWGRSRGRIQTSDDPGTVLEHGWFARYMSSTWSVFGPGGPQIEIRHTPRGPRSREGAVRWLLQLAGAHFAPRGSQPATLDGPRSLATRVLDFGCGGGEEAWGLASDHEVWAVDSPVWFAALRPAAHAVSGRGAKPIFLSYDPVDYAQRVLQGNPPEDSPASVDVVLFRCSLCRVSRREKLLQAAHRLLKPGGVVLATDWIQTRTTDRITWSRLFNTLRFVDLETQAGYEYLSQHLDKDVRFDDFHSWSWDEVRAGTDEPAMDQLFQDRLEVTRRKLAAEDIDNPLSPYARAALLQTQRDLEVLTAMTTQQGPLGWLFWVARKPPA